MYIYYYEYICVILEELCFCLNLFFIERLDREILRKDYSSWDI